MESDVSDTLDTLDSQLGGFLSECEKEYFISLIREETKEAINSADDRERLFKREVPGKFSEIQSNPVFIDYPAFLINKGIQTTGLIKTLMEKNGDHFYLFDSGVTIEKKGDHIDALRYELHFEPASIATFSQVPDSATKDLIKLGADIDLYAGGNGSIGPFQYIQDLISTEVGIKAAAKFYFKTGWTWRYNRTIIDALGINQPYAKWTFGANDMLRDDVNVRAILRIPSDVKHIQIIMKATFLDMRNWARGLLPEISYCKEDIFEHEIV